MQRRLHKPASVAVNALYAPQTASRSVAKSTPWPPFQQFQNPENSSRSAFACRLSTNRLLAGAGRTGPPPRNCLRRIASVGPDSNVHLPKNRLISGMQGRIARVAALSGLTDGWRRVFRGAGPERLADADAMASERLLIFFQPFETNLGGRGLTCAAGKNSPPSARRPQPRHNVGERSVIDRETLPSAQAHFGCGQRALCASDSFPVGRQVNPLAALPTISKS